LKFDELVKSRNSIEFVIPAKAGIQLFQDVLDPGFRRGDAPRDFLRDHQICALKFGACGQGVLDFRGFTFIGVRTERTEGAGGQGSVLRIRGTSVCVYSL
jgi:hypothetical protein